MGSVSYTHLRYQVETGKLFRYIPCPSKDKSKDFPQSICVDKEGTVWVGTSGAGIYRYSPEQDKFVPYATEALKGAFIFTLCDYGDELIVGVHEEELKHKQHHSLYETQDSSHVN